MESEFKDNKYRELQIQVLDSDIERIRIPVMEWVVDTLRIKTNIEGFRVLVLKKHANLKWMEDDNIQVGKMTLRHLKVFREKKGLLKWSIVRDKKSLKLFSEFLEKERITLSLKVKKMYLKSGFT